MHFNDLLCLLAELLKKSYILAKPNRMKLINLTLLKS